MAQVNFYVPDELEKKLRREVKRSGKNLSAFLAGLIRKKIGREEWESNFFEAFFGAWQGDAPEIENEPPEEGESL